MSTNSGNHMFSADRPIRTADEDLLGRVDFARTLATAVSGWRGNDSLVVALYGSWGIGKSSIKNLVLQALQEQKDSPHVVEFNPWQWSGQDQLAQGFFADIQKTLGGADSGKRSRKLERAWRAYAAYLGVSLHATDGSRRAMSWIFGVAGIIALLVPATARYLPKDKAYLPLLVPGLVLLLVAGILRFAKGLLERLADAASSRASILENKTLGEQKSELRNLLGGLDRPLLVVIDDVDRLRPSEIRLLFQLVKANADFPNLAYFLLLQRDIVVASLQDEKLPDGGGEYLEKIVQVGFDVPPVEAARREQALFRGLNRIFDDDAVAKRFDKQRWQSVFMGMRDFFRNLRDVARFLGSLSLHVSLFRKGSSFEVNPVDLIAVEAIRLFEPEVYLRITTNKSLLTSAASPFGGRRERKADQSVLDAILSGASQLRARATKEVLRELFPAVGTLLGGGSYSDSYSDQWYRESRVCHEKVFDRYFLLAIPLDDISQADLDYLVTNAADRSAVRARLMEFCQNGKIDVLLDRLEAFKQALPEAAIGPFVTAIMDVGDLLPEGEPGFFALGPDMHASRFIHWALKCINDKSERAATFRRACLASSGIFLPLREVADQEDKRSIQEHPEWYFLSDDDIDICKQALLDRIRSQKPEGLERSHFLPYVLYRWKKWGRLEEVSQWVNSLLKRKFGAMSLLRRFLGRSVSAPASGGPATVHHRMSLRSIREVADPAAVESALEQIDLNELSDEDRIAIDAFQKARQREKEGKPEEDWPSDE